MVHAMAPTSQTLLVLTLLTFSTLFNSAGGFQQAPSEEGENWVSDELVEFYLRLNRSRTLGAAYADVGSQKVSPQCKKDRDLVNLALLAPDNYTWALLMAEATPSPDRPPPGTMLGRAESTGSYDQCLLATATYKPVYLKIGNNLVKMGDHNFSAHYCKERYVPKDLSSLVGFSRGRCEPTSCNRTDILELMKDVPDTLKYSYCGTKPPLEENAGGIVALVIIGIFLALVVISTIFDTFYMYYEKRLKESTKSSPVLTGLAFIDTEQSHRHGQINESCSVDETNLDAEMARQGEVNGTEPADEQRVQSSTRDVKPTTVTRALVTFSLWRNIPSVLSTKSRGYNCMNGLRFLTMTWIILGHSYQLELYALNDPRTMLAANFYGQLLLLGRFFHMIINNMMIGVNCFFFLSGTLVTVSFLKTLQYLKAQKSNRGASVAKEMALYVFHRYWRLTPLYAALILIWANLWMYFGNGPLWPEWNATADNCKDSWWTNLLYVNNLVRTDKMCLPWAWYLADDFQFFLVVPVFATALFLSPIGGGILLFLGWGGSLAARVVMFDRVPLDFQFIEIYIKPWCRFGPYAIGIGTGYLLYRTKCKVKINKIVVAIGWVLAFALGMLVIFGTYNQGAEGCDDCVVWNKAMQVAYSSTKHDAFTLGIAWMVFACCCGYGGLINSFLSWGLWVPLSKLTYTGYLIHPMIHFVSLASQRQPFYVQDLTVIYQYFGTLMLTIVVSLCMTLVFEVPFLALEKVILPDRKKKSD